ncbi:hypothetical protein BFN03_16705 [Rhodococcus sp. WMMA185]|nr:hypothetical protein BFN03_16705 [Rhodococcus sp. WMMA185]
MKQFAAAAMTTAAAAATVTLATPATASAAGLVDVKAPEVTASSTGTTLNITIENPNKGVSLAYCNAAVVDASSVPDIISDPWTIFDDGVVVFPTFDDISTFLGVYPGQTKSYTVDDLETGNYGVIGACLTALNPGEAPTLSNPKYLYVGNGSLGSSEIPAFGS